MTTTQTARDVIGLDNAHVLQTYRRAPVVFERGNGCRLYDATGRAYLDFISGIGVSSLGHAHPRLSAAIAAQAATLLHTSNLYYHPLQSEVASRLTALSGLPRTFFCNSGTEAVEACLKFARRYWHAQGSPRSEIVALERGFHGRTMGSLSVTWDDHYRAPFGPLLEGVTFVSQNDPDALRRAVSSRTAAVIAEPLQGEGGVRPLEQAMAEAITDACEATGALFIADEVQCGLGRTGVPFHSATLGLRPDLMALGKALGGGVPVGAALFSDRVAASAAFGDHGSTYGGNLLACRAAMVFLDELTSGLLEHVASTGPLIRAALERVAARHPMITGIRGAGVIWGVELDRPAAPVVEAALDRGLLINRTADTVIRMLPPYIVDSADVDQMAVMFDAALGAVTAEEK
ncbi:MAG: acetylornithine/succinylornithine family transaminase [Acidobacteria bacterium]|nr:acetylornithine/succinylornithine family transaminase [Acidobacteriota bacterium]